MPPLLLHAFPTFDAGGAQTRFVTIANHFGERLRHLVIAMDGRTGCAAQFAPEVVWSSVDAGVRKETHTGNLLNFRRILRNVGPALLVTHNWGTMEWAAARVGTAIRHIHIEDGFGPDEAHGQHRRRILARRMLLARSTVVVPSRTLERISRETWRIPSGNIRFIPNGIDVKRFERHDEVVNPVPLIGTVSALRAEKNLPRLLHVFAHVSRGIPCRLKIVGDGPERQTLERLSRELGIAALVDFAGHVSDPSRLYGEFDIFALTSDTEQMPYTVLEAMAASCAIVATDVGDVSRMVAVENRSFVVAPDIQAVSDALIGLLERPSLRRTIGVANHQKVVQEYSQERMFRAFAGVYDLPGLAGV